MNNTQFGYIHDVKLSTPPPRWSVHSFVDRPSILPDTSSYKSIINSFSVTQICECHSFFLVYNHFITPSVTRLLFRCRPPTIFFVVSLIVFNTIKTLTFRALPHISKKALKFLPSFANSNSTTSISVKTHIFFVRASAYHSSPNSISACIRHTVREIKRLSHCISHATTRLRMFGSQVININSYLSTAITIAQEFSVALATRIMIRFFFLYNHQSSIPISPFDLNFFTHKYKTIEHTPLARRMCSLVAS